LFTHLLLLSIFGIPSHCFSVNPVSQLRSFATSPSSKLTQFTDFNAIRSFNEVKALGNKPYAAIAINRLKIISAGLKPEHVGTLQKLRLDFMHCSFPQLHLHPETNKLHKLTGFHWDPHGSLEKSGLIRVQEINKGLLPSGFYDAQITVNGISKKSTFFPKEWGAETIASALQEVLSGQGLHCTLIADGQYRISGLTKEGFPIKAFWNPNQPCLNNFFPDAIQYLKEKQ